MKKVLVAAAGLMLVGTMASSAMADFKFSGDARARFYMQENYDFKDSDGNVLEIGNFAASDSDTHWNSRVRFKIDAETKGGAYAKTRVRLAEATWDGTENTRAKGEGSNFYTDWAYIGVPFGAVTVEAGLMPRNITPWFFWDGRADGVNFRYSADNTDLLAFYDIEIEGGEDDAVTYGIVLNQKFSGGMGLTAAAMYIDDEIGDEDYLAGTVKVDATMGATALTAEVSYVEDAGGTDDDGFGGYVSATMPMGAVELTGTAGFTVDGFTMDNADWGPWIILNDVSQIGTGINFASLGDSIFVALTPSFKVSEKLTIGGNVAWANIDDTGIDADLFEIGAKASYAVTDGASLNAVVGYADTDDVLADDPFGFGLSLEISF